ncbi:amidohydrolase family protein [Microvirga aerophila]|uniref:Amidohydrolase n=1 Tax=Microvirga aerophila TaxID=670291 RepID=A0A512BQ99_9HYPH|nr:amidohydrolase family protein [Microvirga aerophila]GEO14196.1 amidohydrolase [Microvirga aerophila]
MTTVRTIDVHAHILTEETMRRMRAEAPDIGPTLSEVDQEGGVLTVGSIVQRPFPRGAWDLELRLRDMDAAEVDVQVLSVCPQTFLYDRDPALTATLSAIQNEEIAKVVSQHPDRFLGIATLPMQDPERAVAELRRSMTELGLRGAQIGSHVEGRNLDDPALEPLWAAAAELGAFILVHPQKTAANDRLKSYYLKNLIGNPLDTTIAAASLVFGGVLERYPDLKFCFAHGGGFMPYQTGRMNHGYDVRPEGKVNLKEAPEASIRRLYFDCILHFEPALRYLVETFGADHVLLGSDYPFDMGLLDCVKQVRALKASIEDRNLILGTAAAGLLGDVQSPAKRAAQAG